MTTPTFKPLLSAVFLFLLTVRQVPAAVIDLFTDGPQTAGITAQPTRDNRNAIPLTDSLFESRSLYVGYNTERASIQNRALTYELPLNPITPDDRGYFGLNYTSSTPVDLLGDGATAFLVKFEFFEATFPYSLGFYVGDPGLQGSSYKFLIRDFSTGLVSSAEAVIPFSYFSKTDLTQVKFLGIDASRMPAGSSFVISSITTVPEPSVALLTSGFAIVCLFHRRRNHPPALLE